MCKKTIEKNAANDKQERIKSISKIKSLELKPENFAKGILTLHDKERTSSKNSSE